MLSTKQTLKIITFGAGVFVISVKAAKHVLICPDKPYETKKVTFGLNP